MVSTPSVLPPLTLQLFCDASGDGLELTPVSLSSRMGVYNTTRTLRSSGSRLGLAANSQSLVNEAVRGLTQKLQVPIEAWFFAADYPSRNPQVQAAVTDENGMAFIKPTVLSFNSGLPVDHPLGSLKPGLRIEIRKGMPNQDRQGSHPEHIFNAHLTFSEMIPQLLKCGLYNCEAVTAEDNNMKFTLQISLSKFNLSTPSELQAASSQLSDLRKCLDTVVTYELDREKKNGYRLESVQQMLNAITTSSNERSLTCAQFVQKITGYKGMDFGDRYPTRIPLMWSREFGSNVPLTLDTQQSECLLQGCTFGGHQDFIMALALNASTSVAVEITQEKGLNVEDPASVHAAVVQYLKETPPNVYRNRQLVALRDMLGAISDYTNDPSWKLGAKLTMLSNPATMAPKSATQSVNVLGKVNVDLQASNNGMGEDQSIPGFNLSHWMIMANSRTENAPISISSLQGEVGKEKLPFLTTDCEDYAHLIGTASKLFDRYSAEDMEQCVQSTCEFMPASVSEIKPTLCLMMQAMKRQPTSAPPMSDPVHISSFDSKTLLNKINQARNQEGEVKTCPAAILAKAISIGESQVSVSTKDLQTNQNVPALSAGMFDTWWREQPLNGHAIVTSMRVVDVATVVVDGRSVCIQMLKDIPEVVEGTGPAYQIATNTSTEFKVDLDRPPTNALRMNLNGKLKQACLNCSMAGNVRSSLHVTEVQNLINMDGLKEAIQRTLISTNNDVVETNMPLSSYVLAARQTFSLNCEVADTYAQQKVTTDNLFYVTFLACGLHGVAYSADTNNLLSQTQSTMALYHGAPIVRGLVKNAETLFFSSKMDKDEERRCKSLGALTGLTMLKGEQLIQCLPNIASRSSRLQMQYNAQMNTFIPLTPAQLSTSNQFQCGLFSKAHARIDESTTLKHLGMLADNVLEVTSSMPVVQVNGFTSNVCLRYQ
jgi:hypothetical protein